MFGILKSLLGKSSGNSYEEMSPEVLKEKIAERTRKIDELRRMLKVSEGALGTDKSAAWLADMEGQLRTANSKNDSAAKTQIQNAISEAEKKRSKVAAHIEEVNRLILVEEDEVELMERALSNR